MPRAHMLPSFNTELSETLAPGNPLGVRGGGEGGTTPALGVVVNAVVDALSGLRRDAHRDAADGGEGVARDTEGRRRLRMQRPRTFTLP